MKFSALLMAAAAFACMSIPTKAQTQSAPPPATSPQKEAPVTNHASGPFDVNVVKQEDPGGDTSIGRFTLDKRYHGDLDGTGKGQMLTASTEVKGSGAYVAIERVTATLKGREGTFALEHMGTMAQNVPQLTINIVPDSGTGQLKGLTGKMNITIAEDGKHSYDLEYTIPNGTQ
jgi:Protein of unknown function (DUF3224)